MPKSLFTILFLCLLGTPTWAQTNVGTVDIARVLQSPKGQALYQSAEALFETQKLPIDTWSKDLEEKKRSVEDRPQMDSTTLHDTYRDLRKLEQNLYSATEENTRRANEIKEKALEGFRKELLPILKEVASEKSLDLILTQDPSFKSEGVKLVDVTQAVINKYNAPAP